MITNNQATGGASKTIVTVIGFVLLLIGIVAALYTVSKPQDTRQQAQVVVPSPSTPSTTCTTSNPNTTSNNSCAGDLTNVSNSCQTNSGQNGYCQINTQSGGTTLCDCIAGQPAICTVVFSVPTPTPSFTPSPTPSNTPTPSPSFTPTPTPTRTPTPSPTPSPTNTPTATPTNSPTPTPTRTPTPSPSFTPTPTPTRTPTPSPTPTNTPTPVPTATPMLLCLSIQLTPPNPTLGQPLTVTCGNVAGAYRYEFRIGLPNGSIISLAPSSPQSNVSQPYTIAQSGPHGAQCRLCMGVDDASCQPWEQP